MISSADRVQKHRPVALWGKSLVDKTFENQARLARKQDLAFHGEPYDRSKPKPGVSILVPDEDIADMADSLVSNGLENFEARVAIQTYWKAVDPSRDARVPTVDCSQTVEESDAEENRFFSDLQINIIDPVFSTGNKTIPSPYIDRVLTSLHPAELILGIQKELKDYVSRAFKPGNIKFIGNVLASVAIAWRGKQIPRDPATVQAVLKGVMGHEFCHGLVLALPAGDMPEPQKARLETITFEAYQKLLQEDSALHGSVALFKNVYKAVRAVHKQIPSEKTGDDLIRIMSEEMFNDRFSLYLDQNHRKNLIYRDVLGIWKEKDAEWLKKKKDHYFFTDWKRLDQAEQARLQGELGSYLKSQGVAITPDRLAKLENDLQASEKTHFLISIFNDPQLTSREIVFYGILMNHLRALDQENALHAFTRQHVETSDPVKMVQTQLISRAY
jgi:hypothetical protein